mgnify:CR=1 FL=1
MSQHKSHCDPQSRVSLDTRTWITIFGFLLITGIATVLPSLSTLEGSLYEYIRMTWWAVLLGFFLGGVIDHFVPEDFIFRIMGRRRTSSIFAAVISGFILSACSHGILALSMQLYKKGASIPAVIAFLLATPWANLPVTILLFGFFGWQAFVFIGGAMLIAVTTGLCYQVLARHGLIEDPIEVQYDEDYEWEAVKNFEFKQAVRGTWQGSLSLMNMVLWWILLGILASAVIGAYVPDEFMTRYLGMGIYGLLLTLGVATIIEVCSEASSPIAFEIYQSVGSLGNPFVFLMAGVATDYTEIGLLWTTIGKRAALWLPVIAVLQIVFLAWLFNVLI